MLNKFDKELYKHVIHLLYDNQNFYRELENSGIMFSDGYPLESAYRKWAIDVEALFTYVCPKMHAVGSDVTEEIYTLIGDLSPENMDAASDRILTLLHMN